MRSLLFGGAATILLLGVASLAIGQTRRLLPRRPR